MSVLFPLALLLGLTALVPILAHALRSSRASVIVFPAAHLVTSKTSSAKQRHRIEDRFLLLLRILLLLLLTLLAASPFTSCSQVSLTRTDGASLAATLIIDDSASMRARLKNGTPRLTQAIDGARQLLNSAQPGDSFSIVLAGYPARVLTPPTTELASVEIALDSIVASDRRTDIVSALSLARSLQDKLSHLDTPIVLLSDLGVSQGTELDLTGVTLPQEELRTPLSNCALISASPAGTTLVVELACTDKEAVEGRQLQVLTEDDKKIAAQTEAQDGAVQIEIPQAPERGSDPIDLSAWRVQLTRPQNEELDQIPEDDQTPVLQALNRLSVGVRADESKAGLKTGTGTVLRAAIESLDMKTHVQDLSVLPESAQGLERFSALFIDDASGFTPEQTETLSDWVEDGGVAVLFAGPGLTQAPLGSGFSPFVSGALKWVPNKDPGIDPDAPSNLGPLASSWSDLRARSRALLAEDPDLHVRARWKDGEALVVEKLLGRGSLYTVGLPSSVDQSDLALRPAFVEFIQLIITQASLSKGAGATLVGQPWPLPKGVVVFAPDGRPLNIDSSVQEHPNIPKGPETAASHSVEPQVAGRYKVSSTDGTGAASFRYAMRDPSEHILQSDTQLVGLGGADVPQGLVKVDISRYVALLLLVLGVLELAFRVHRRRRGTTLTAPAFSAP